MEAAAAAREALVSSSSSTSMAATARDPLVSSCSSASVEEAEAAAAAAEDLGDGCDTWLPPFWEDDPTDDDLVLHCLRRRLRGFVPYGAVLRGDPYSKPPWELLPRDHKIREGLFFAERRARHSKGAKRTVGDVGIWKTKYRIRGVSHTYFGCRVEWRKSKLRYCVRRDRALESAGWYMWEYEITNPECYRRPCDGDEGVCWVLCRIVRRKRPRANAQSGCKRAPGGLLWDAVEVNRVVEAAATAVSDATTGRTPVVQRANRTCDKP